MKRSLIAAVFALGLVGCASSPQQVHLNPDIAINSRLAKQPAVQLTINDLRSSSSMGTRGGVYGDSNHITADRNLSDSLRPAAVKALNELGARVDAPSPFPIALTLDIERIVYHVDPNSSVPLLINLEAAIRASASKEGKQFSGRYESSKQHKFAIAPSDERNAEIINDILSETLARVFNDPRLLTFLEQ